MYLAVDIGGTKTLLAVLDEAGQITAQKRLETPQNYADLIAQIEQAANGLGQTEFAQAAAGVPGLLDRQQGVAKAFGNRDWTNVPIKADLERVLKTGVLIENDSKLAALSEAQLVKDRYNKVLYITIGTGIGTGLVVNGQLDPDTLDSESGQMPLEHDGQTLTWEDFASGKAIYERYGKKIADIDDPAAWQSIAHNIAMGLINLVAALAPEVIILGGGVGAHLDKYQKELMAELDKLKNPMITIPPVLPAQRPEEAVIYGCLELIKASHAGSASPAAV